MAGSADVVIGVDIGTTATKVVAYDARGTSLASASEDYPLRQPETGAAVQEPPDLVAAVRTAVRAVTGELAGRPVAGVSFSSAMHSLIGLDDDGSPLTPLITWADMRADAQADRLRAEGRALALHRRTGTPVHPMSPLVKLMWLREERRDLHDRVRRWCGVKEYLLQQWCDGDGAVVEDAFVSDHSIASATGLLALDTLDWDAEALELAGVRPEQLPRPVPTTTVLRALSPAVASDLGLPAGTPIVVGASDGPLANLGIGAVRPGQAACSIGTSAALRVMVEKPAVDPAGGVFCYAFLPGRWVVGGALNNGGVVLGWAHDALAPELGEDAPAVLSELAATAPPGSGGLLMLPYLLGERAPHWSSLPQGAYVGLSRAHRREHLVRAALEGVCLQLAIVHDALEAAGVDVREVRATGGFARSPFWRQLLADVLGTPVQFPAGHDGSAFGAALLGMEALELVGSIDLAVDLVQVESTLTPDADSSGLYAELRPVFARLFEQLTPAFAELRRLAPEFAGDPTPGTSPEQAGRARSTT
jgi:gluconokinase